MRAFYFALLWLGNFKTSGCLVGRPTCASATTRLTPQLVGTYTITNNLSPYTVLRPLPRFSAMSRYFPAGPTRGGGSRAAVPGPMNLKLKNEIGNYAQSFYCYNFVYSLVQINWLKLLFQSLYNVSPFILVCVLENLNCCCCIASPMH